MEIHQPKARGAILLMIDKLSSLLDTVVDVLRTSTPGPFAVLLPLNVVTGAHGQLSLGAVSRYGPSQRR